MFKIETLEPFVLYLLQNNYFYLYSFKLSCKNFYHYITNHNIYKKIYSCNLLNYHIQNRLKISGFGYSDIKNILEINDIPNYSNKNNIIEIKRDFKTIINLFKESQSLNTGIKIIIFLIFFQSYNIQQVLFLQKHLDIFP